MSVQRHHLLEVSLQTVFQLFSPKGALHLCGGVINERSEGERVRLRYLSQSKRLADRPP